MSSPGAGMLDEDTLDALEAAGVDEIKVRTPLTCGTRFGLCASATAATSVVAPGQRRRAVGVIAAQSIGEPVRS